VRTHGLAFFLSLINVVRAASLFNERLTFTVMVTPLNGATFFVKVQYIVRQTVKITNDKMSKFKS
jgi:hypothetical protein